MSDKMAATSATVAKLIKQAQELADFAKQLDNTGNATTYQAQAILKELDKLLAMDNEWQILQVLEASVAPKLINLAKELRVYKQLMENQTTTRKPVQKSYYQPVVNTSAFDKFTAPKPKPPLSDEEEEKITATIASLKTRLEKFTV